MLAYIVRRLLLIVPTLFGIMLLNFVIVQAAPGGPVEHTHRPHQGHRRRGDRARSAAGGAAETRRAAPRRSGAGGDTSSQYRGARGLDPELIKAARAQFGFDKPPAERFVLMMRQLPALRLRQELLPRPLGDRAGHRQAAGVDLARPLDDAARLPDLDPARHRQGGARRLALRRLDERGGHRRQRDPELPVRDPADRAVRRRQLPRLVPAARPGLGRLGAARPGRRAIARLPLAHDAAGARRW